MLTIDPPPLPIPHIRRTPRVTIAFVNNTSDRALASTEAQFLALLRPATADIELHVGFFTCPGIARAAPPRTRLGTDYADMASLIDSHPDAVVVTGMEPTRQALPDEPVWQPLTRLIDWVEARGIPSIWSCLAAHAAVLRLDGIDRMPHPAKVSDLLCCKAIADRHPLMSGLPPQWWAPHSRYYGLPEETLVAGGYQVLSRTTTAGADMFIRDGRSPFVFLQGHPEYQHDSLLKEYKRDLRRYFDGSRDEYPIAPTSYFRRNTALTLERIRQYALQDPGRARADGTLLSQVLAIADCGVAPVRWENVAARIYANWMASFVLGIQDADSCACSATEAGAALPQISTPEPLFSK